MADLAHTPEPSRGSGLDAAAVADLARQLAGMRTRVVEELRLDDAAIADGEARHEPGSFADDVELARQTLVHEAETTVDRALLAEIDAALQRLRTGRYGACADCGEPIGLERLRAQPATVRCLACQERAEAAHRA